MPERLLNELLLFLLYHSLSIRAPVSVNLASREASS